MSGYCTRAIAGSLYDVAGSAVGRLMARRRKQSPGEDFMDLVAMLPWWGVVALAVVSYLLLHQMAATPKPTSLQPGQVGQFAVRSLLAMFAFYGQVIVPVLCLIGAFVSFLKRRRR